MKNLDKEFDKKFGEVVSNKEFGGADYNEVGGYIKDFIRQREKELLEEILKDFKVTRPAQGLGSAGAGVTLAAAIKYIEGKLGELSND
jgi:hypothetical protein